MDPLNTRTVVEMANEQLRPSTTKSSSIRKAKLLLDHKNHPPVSSSPNSESDDGSRDRSSSSIKKSKQTFNQKALNSRKASQFSSPKKEAKYVFSPSSASAFNSENQQNLSRTVTRLAYKAENVDKIYVTERLHEDQKYFRLTTTKLTQEK